MGLWGTQGTENVEEKDGCVKSPGASLPGMYRQVLMKTFAGFPVSDSCPAGLLLGEILATWTFYFR